MIAKHFITPRRAALALFLALFMALATGCGSNGKRLSDARNEVRGVCISQIGAPYKFDGDDRTGFDAGGLTAFCYREAGYDTPKYPEGQLRAGQPIDYAEIEKGDILFYRLRQLATGDEARLHSGIFVGSDKMIHASADRDEVVSDSIGGSYWKDRLVAVIRILP